MKPSEYIKAVIEHKGQNLAVEVEKQLKTKVANRGDKITKHTRFVCRTGIQYDNIKDVKDARDSGELPSENDGLPWGKWNTFPYVIEHNGTDYLRLYPSSDKKLIPHTEYFLNGKQVTKQEVQDKCLASEFKKSDGSTPKCWTIKADNVKSIGKHSA